MNEVQLHLYDPRRNAQQIVETINSSGRLQQRLEEIQSHYESHLDQAIGVSLVDKSGNSLSVGLGKSEWALIYSRMVSGELVEQYASLGDDSREGSVAFYFEQWTDIPRKWLIPQSLAKEAVNEWFRSGKLSEVIRWTSDAY